MLAEVIRRIFDGEVLVSELGGNVFFTVPGGYRDALMPWDKLVLDHQRTIAIEWMNTAMAIARQPVTERPLLWRTWESEIIRVHRTRHGFLTARLPLS